MNPAYRHARFRAELPQGGLPESFAVITACNPNGKTLPDKHNLARTRAFQQQLDDLQLDHFPVTGYDSGSPHAEPGFAVTCDLDTAVSLGDSLSQEAVFFVQRGEIALVSCGTEREHIQLGRWSERTDAPAARPLFHFRGPSALLAAPATAFLCSTKCPAAKVAEAYDWARQQCDEKSTVISGFHTPVEKDVLAILARRGTNILWATPKELPKTTPAELKTAHAEQRLLILSPFPYGSPSRATRESCSQRNRFVLDYASDRYIPHVAEDSSLASDLVRLEL